MKILKRILICLIVLLLTEACSYARPWNNNLKSLLSTNTAIISSINIRSFGANHNNSDRIIDEKAGDIKGSLLNDIDKLDIVKASGINVIEIMPITPVGKYKALGTAGSLFAPSSFNQINPQLKDSNSNFTLYNEVRTFINECHNRNINVIVDLPCCASYDLYLKRPELFKKDKNGQPIIPSDWTDVRLLDAGTDSQINNDVYNLYAEFIDMITDLGFDGVKANEPEIKPYIFWSKLISETKSRIPNFIFFTDASEISHKQIPQELQMTDFNKLLAAGCDSYYGTYNDMKTWKSANELYNSLNKDKFITKEFNNTKNVVGNFATHDELSPILEGGFPLSQMIIWLNAVLPINSYYLDGFPTGADYIYFWGNKKAPKTYTDDEYYFVHRGQFDIFNFSAPPKGKYPQLYNDFITANRFKLVFSQVLNKGKFDKLRTFGSHSVFAFSQTLDQNKLIVIGNLDYKNPAIVSVIAPKISPKTQVIPIHFINTPKVSRNKIQTMLNPGEIQVLVFNTDR